MTTLISIAHEEPAAAVARVTALLDDVALTDCNWNGASFHIVRDDFTCIPDDDSSYAVELLGKIHRALDGNDE